MMSWKKITRQAYLALALAALFLTTAVAHAQYPELSSVRIHQIEKLLPVSPAGFGPPCADRTAWAKVAANYQWDVHQADAFLAKPLPKWSNAAYLSYSRTGSRKAGDAMIRSRTEQLAPLVLAECSEWNGRYLPRIIELLNSFSREPSWSTPGNDPSLGNFSGKHRTVTLDSAALANSIAEALYLLGDKVPASTRKRAIAALNLQVFDPMLRAFKGHDQPFWLHVHDNWNAVCLDGVTGAALAILPSRKERALFAAAAEHYSNNFIKEFHHSGYDDEGIGYWNYGYGNYAQLREELWHSTKGKIDLYDNPMARKAALFGFQFQMLPGVYADFADAHFMSKPSPILLYRLNRIFGLGFYSASSKIPASAYREPLPSAVLASFPNHSKFHASAPHLRGQKLLGLRTYYSDVGVLVDRPAAGGDLAITIKANGNSAHSHNDKGSFSIGLGDTQPLGDPGGPDFYTAQTFSRNRYKSKLLNSFGHPVPEIGNHLQLDATKVLVKVLGKHFSAEQDSLTMDLTNAYDAPSLTKLVRTMRYSRRGRGSIEIVDEYTLKQPTEIVESLPTHGICRRINAKTLEFDYQGARLRVTIEAPVKFTVDQVRVDDPHNGNPFTRVGVRMRLAAGFSQVKMRFAPAQ